MASAHFNNDLSSDLTTIAKRLHQEVNRAKERTNDPDEWIQLAIGLKSIEEKYIHAMRDEIELLFSSKKKKKGGRG